jgi:hypothetical protein
VKEYAKRFVTQARANLALRDARKYRPFTLGKVVEAEDAWLSGAEEVKT